MGADDGDGVGVGEECCASEELVGGGGQGVLVGSAVEGVTGELLGGGVGEGADGEAGGGETGGVVEGPGNAEVGEVDAALAVGVGLTKQDVGGFDVAVQQAVCVGIVQGSGDAGGDFGDLIGRHAGGVAAC